MAIAEIAQLVEHNLAKVGVSEFESRFPLKTGGSRIDPFFFVGQRVTALLHFSVLTIC